MHRWQTSKIVRFGQTRWVSIDPLPVVGQEEPKYAVFVSESLETQILTEQELIELLAGIKGARKKRVEKR